MNSAKLARNLMLAATLILASCGQSNGLAPREENSYYGNEANEAEFSFKAYTLMPLSAEQPSEQAINNEIKLISKFMMGHMDDDGSISYNYTTKIKKIEKKDNNYKVSYEFKGKGVFRSKFKDYEFIVPIVPRELFRIGDKKCRHSAEGGEDLYWYDWSINSEGCPLVKDEHYLKIKTSLKIINSTKESYPEYEKLVVNDKLTVTAFFGAANHENTDWNPMAEVAETSINERDDDFGNYRNSGYRNTDAGAAAYRQMRSYIISLGFSVRRYEDQELREIYNPKAGKKLPFVEELTKVGTNGRTMKVRIAFLETQYSSDNSEGFHYLLKNALKNDSVVIYDGHSGLGKNLNLDQIGKRYGSAVTLNPNYQIIFFGSCIPYAYYADMYFQRKVNSNDKNGTKSLDIFAYAKEAYFGNTEDQRVLTALDKYLFTGERTSYQAIVTSLPRDLFGVVGDEDNN